MRHMGRWIPLLVVAGLIGVVMVYGQSVVGQIAYAVESGRLAAVRSNLAELSERDQLSVLFREVAKAVKPAVVMVRVTHWVRMPDFGDMFPDMRRFFGDDSPFRFRIEPRPRETPQRRMPQIGLGSGVVVDAKHGYVVTNEHVVRGADKVEVILADERKLEAEWVRSDRHTDVAVVKVEPDRLVDAPLGNSDRMEVGDWVLAIGAPEKLPQTVTAGIVSAKGRTTGRGGYEDYIQTDAAINHGNSGGPLVNTRGEVIGISAAIVTRTGGNEGIGFAVPSNMVEGVMEQLVEKGKVVRGLLGVYFQDVSEPLAESFKLPTAEGTLVTEVVPDSPAARAGLKVSDFIIAIDGKGIANGNELRNVIAAIAPGTKVTVDLYRDGKKISVPVEIAEASEQDLARSGGPPSTETAAKRFGLEVARAGQELARRYGYDRTPEGVFVTGVAPGSDAADQGVREGMVITHVENKAVTSVKDFDEAISVKGAERGVRLRLETPAGRRRFVFLTPEKGEK